MCEQQSKTEVELEAMLDQQEQQISQLQQDNAKQAAQIVQLTRQQAQELRELGSPPPPPPPPGRKSQSRRSSVLDDPSLLLPRRESVTQLFPELDLAHIATISIPPPPPAHLKRKNSKPSMDGMDLLSVLQNELENKSQMLEDALVELRDVKLERKQLQQKLTESVRNLPNGQIDQLTTMLETAMQDLEEVQGERQELLEKVEERDAVVATAMNQVRNLELQCRKLKAEQSNSSSLSSSEVNELVEKILVLETEAEQRDQMLEDSLLELAQVKRERKQLRGDLAQMELFAVEK